MPASAPPSSADARVQMEEIRHAMLLSLGDSGRSRELALGRKLRMTDDIQTLWFARSELMQCMADSLGETRAREQMSIISGLFDGLISESITSHKKRK